MKLSLKQGSRARNRCGLCGDPASPQSHVWTKAAPNEAINSGAFTSTTTFKTKTHQQHLPFPHHLLQTMIKNAPIATPPIHFGDPGTGANDIAQLLARNRLHDTQGRVQADTNQSGSNDKGKDNRHWLRKPTKQKHMRGIRPHQSKGNEKER